MFRYGFPSSPLTTHTYTSHTLQYDQVKKVPVWVCERLTKEDVRGEANRRHSTFKVTSGRLGHSQIEFTAPSARPGGADSLLFH